MLEPIVLYDLARPGAMFDSEQSWSGNTLNFVLNIKGLPFRTEWIKLADVESKMKSLGLEPSHSGLLPYTVPTIVDPNTKRVITDSFAIAQYLDEVYPDTSAIVPAGTAAFQRAFVDKVVVSMLLAALPSLVGPVYEVGCFDEADRAHYRKTREAWFGGKSLETIMKIGEEGVEGACKACSEGLDEIAEYAKKAGGEGLFLSEQGPWFVDTAVAGALTYIVKACGKGHSLSKVILEHEWASKLLIAFGKWA